MLAFLAWIANMVLINKELRFRRTPLDLPILAFTGIAVLSAIFSVDYYSSIFGYFGRFGDGLIILIPLVLFYFLIINKTSVDNDKQVITVSGLLRVLLASTFIVVLMSYLSVLGIWQTIAGIAGIELPEQMLLSSFNPVAFSTFSASGLAMYLSIILLIIVGMFLSDIKKSFKGIPLAVLFFSILSLLIIIDYNPSWIVLLISLFVFTGFMLWKRVFREQVNLLMIPILLIIVSAIFLIPAVSPRNIEYNAESKIIARIIDIAPETVLDAGTNLIIAKGAITEDIKSVFLGSGIGTFHYDFAKFKPLEINQKDYWSIRFNRSGSHIVEILATMGVLGLLAYLSIIGLALMIVFFLIQTKLKLPKSAKKEEVSSVGELPLILPLFLAFIGLFVAQLIYYQNVLSAFLFWFFLALLMVALKGPVKEKKISFKSFPELSLIFNVLLFILILGIGVLWFFNARFYLAEVNYAQAMNEQKDGQKIIDKLEKAVQLNPYQPYYRVMLSRSYFNMAYLETMKQDTDLAVIKEYVINAANYGGEEEVEKNYIENGQEKTKTIVGVAKMVPNEVIVWENLAVIYRDIRSVIEPETRNEVVRFATESFLKAIELEPNNPVLHSALGKLYLSEGEAEKAKQEFAKTVELKEDYLEGLVQGALAYEEENMEEAVRRMEKAYNDYPQQPEICFQLGRLYYNNDQTDEAIRLFEKAVVLMPNYSNALYSLAMAYQRQGNKELSLQYFNQVLQLNPGNEDVQEKIKQLRATN